MERNISVKLIVGGLLKNGISCANKAKTDGNLKFYGPELRDVMHKLHLSYWSWQTDMNQCMLQEGSTFEMEIDKLIQYFKEQLELLADMPNLGDLLQKEG